MNRHSWTATAPICLSILVAGAWLANAGSLTPPPGPISPTMKDLDTVEPRIALRFADLPITITSPGSYYLAEDIAGPPGGITIDASNVTLDLNGFTLDGAGFPADGIEVLALGYTGISIFNGTVTGWGGVGIDAGFTDHCRFANLRLAANAGEGLIAGIAASIVNCTANGNGAFGFITGSSCTFQGCAAIGNAFDGYFLGANCTLRGCTAESNFTGFLDVGGGGSTFENCTASFNDVGFLLTAGSEARGCTAAGNFTTGFFAMDSSSIIHCQATGNGFDGIYLSVNCHAVGNRCGGNGAAGIVADATGNRIEQNTVTTNDVGIATTPAAAGNVILKNAATANVTADYDILGADAFGPIVPVAGAGDLTGIADHPWTNFAY
jgi:parallel beta-helix repeat protein